MTKGSLSNPCGAHLSETTFRRYEATLMRFVERFPRILSVVPTSVAPTTYRAQICNAANAHITHRFESSLDPDALASAWSAAIVTISDGAVILGPRAAVREQLAAQRAPDAIISTQSFLTTIDSPTLDQLNALAYLYATGVFTTPTQITGTLPDGFVELPNTALTATENYWTLL